ncbi:MAG: hypothetical protein LBS83_00315 [Holosporales bacterium]|jgi:hypothetical protein|nr:hypothetical protein [Holosporales bacterium]
MKGMLFGVLLGIGIVGSGVCVAREDMEGCRLLLPETTKNGVTFKKIIRPDLDNNLNYSKFFAINLVRECIEKIISTDKHNYAEFNILADELIRLECEFRDYLIFAGFDTTALDVIWVCLKIRILETGLFDYTIGGVLCDDSEEKKQMYAKMLEYNGKPISTATLSIAGLYIYALHKLKFGSSTETESYSPIFEKIKERIIKEEFPICNYFSWAIKKAIEHEGMQKEYC